MEAKTRLITKADLERHLPRELPFLDRTLRLKAIRTLRFFRVLLYTVVYEDEDEDLSEIRLRIPRLPLTMLPTLLERELRAMYWWMVGCERARRMSVTLYRMRDRECS